MNSTIIKLLPGSRSIVQLLDSSASMSLIQRELLKAKLSYTALAKAAGVASSTVSNIATGTTRRPQLETVIKLLGALGWVITAQRKPGDEK